MKMKTKTALAILLCFALAIPAWAMGSKPKTLDHGPLIKAVDTNKDGRMSLEEWQAVGLPMSSFDMLNQDGYVTEQMMLEEGAPDGIDINGDGALKLEEFLEFDKVMSQQMATSGGPGGPPAAADNRSTISEGEIAYIALQVQNLMSKHAYYHAAGMHLEELEAIWVDENGEYAESATFASPNWIMVGISGIKKYYGQVNQENKIKELEAVSKLYPEIKNIEENLGAGHEYAMHTTTTPVIEVAGDGKTAKGIWYSPGIGLSARINGANVNYGGTFFWEKYGADFIKENGKWKMWHCQMWYDWTPSFPSSMTSSIGRSPMEMAMGDEQADKQMEQMMGGPGAPPLGGPGGPPGGGQGAPPPGGPGGDQGGRGAIEAGERMQGGQSADMLDNTENNYETYSVKRVPTIEPRFPEPYYTFSETFSY